MTAQYDVPNPFTDQSTSNYGGEDEGLVEGDNIIWAPKPLQEGNFEETRWEVESIMKATINTFKEKQLLSINKAFPTFKVYVIDEGKLPYALPLDKVKTTATYFDITDWVIDFRTIDNRENPISYAMLSLDDSDGYLSGQGSFFNPTLELLSPAGSDKRPKPEDIISSGGILRPGLSIEVRAGYSNNENVLPTIFIGQILTIMGSDTLQVECQSWGSELTVGAIVPDQETEIKDNYIGIAKDKLEVGNCSEASTGNVIRSFFRGTERGTFNVTAKFNIDASLAHFGKYYIREALSNETLPDQRLISVDNANERTTENIYLPDDDPILLDKENYTWLENTFPAISFGGSWFDKFVLSKWEKAAFNSRGNTEAGSYQELKLNVYKLTLWDILQVLLRRHPGWICQVVPYRTSQGTEMTVFFGPPTAPYLWIGKNPYQQYTLFTREAEMPWSSAQKKGSRQAKEWLFSLPVIGDLWASYDDLNIIAKTLLPVQLAGSAGIDAIADIYGGYTATVNKRGTTSNTQNVRTMEARAHIRPFKNFHIVSSGIDLIDNGIVADAEGTYNSVRVYYPKDKDNLSVDGAGNIPANIEKKTFEVKADDSILPADTRILEVEDNNAHLTGLARLSAISRLVDSLKDLYKGSLLILGNPDIKPNDTIILNDTYSGMYGAIDVQEVEHIVSADTGFVTRIKPDLVVGSILAPKTLIITAGMLEFLLGTSVDYSTIINTRKPLALTTDFSFKKLHKEVRDTLTEGLNYKTKKHTGARPSYLKDQFIIWWWGKSRDAEPIAVLPLIKNGQPFLTGLKGFNRDGNYFGLTQKGWMTYTEYTKDFINRATGTTTED